MDTKTPAVSIVILNYNTTSYTIKCIESIEEKTQSSVDYELIVVDNASEDSQQLDLKSYIEGRNFGFSFQFIISDKNLGFSAGNQLGADKAVGKYVFFLNNDCFLKNDVVSILYKFMEENKNAGICTARMLNEHGEPQRSFTYLTSVWLTLFGWQFMKVFNKKRYISRDIDYKSPQKVDVAEGAALFIRKKVFDAIGGFDLSYFFYWEEHDLAMRMKKHKLDVYFIPQAEYFHYMGKSTAKSFEVRREFYISLFIFFRKYYNVFERFFFRLFYLQKFGLKPKRKHFFKLFLFILKGAPHKESLRYKQ
jgi:GT2 family glycosyltransferase